MTTAENAPLISKIHPDKQERLLAYLDLVLEHNRHTNLTGESL
jgi:16S rRNA G527 N7-methylase RsmG